MILMIDNYDSFSFNLVQYFGELGKELIVYRNDQISVEEIGKLEPNYIVISSGPGTPDDAGISLQVVKTFGGTIPILGISLGLHVIAQAFKGNIMYASKLMHGKASSVNHDNKSLFFKIPSPFSAARYHSLIVDKMTLPDCLEISAWTKEGEIMGLRHKQYVVEGIQFQPDSIITDYGKEILSNFLDINKEYA